MLTTDAARRLALALPEVVERDHHGRASFRVEGKIIATLWTERQLNVMVDGDAIRTAVQAHPDACAAVWWGKRLSAVGVDLGTADSELVEELLDDAWERRAPARLIADRGR